MFENIEDGLRTIADYLVGKNIGHVYFKAGQTARRDARKFAVWDWKLLRRTKMGLKPVAPIDDRVKVLKILHDNIVHWDIHTTRKLVSDRF